MVDLRYKKLAQILVDHSAHVGKGDRVAIETTTNAEELVSQIYELVLERGGHPHLILGFPDQEKTFFRIADDEQLSFTHAFQKLVTDQFEVDIRIRAEVDPRSLIDVAPCKQSLRQKAMAPVRNTMIARGATNSLRWVVTQFPTVGYAKDADMSIAEYADFIFSACHADDRTPDPVNHWQNIQRQQAKIIERIEGHREVKLNGPDVDLSLSIQGRKFNNGSGQHNIPDGEIFTSPVEDAARGWVRFTYPAIYQGQVVEGIELKFEDGRVVSGKAKVGEQLLLTMIDSDEGSHYLGEFAIGTNYEINRFTTNLLFDEKIGGTFHLALGTGFPEAGSRNTSNIHWDMICDLRNDSEISVDGDVIYKNGIFI